jgi:uncharacterized repeat protein (TIGR02543 family)
LAEFTDAASVPNTEFYVEPGNWDFTVEGYKESVVVLSGSLTSQAIPATGASLTLSVSPVSGADGTVKISIQLPSDSGITSAQIIKEGDDVGTYHPDASGLVVFEADYPAGVYYIVVKLYNGDNELYGVFSETYYVWAHLLSENTYAPAREDLNSIYTVELHDWHEVNGDVSSTHEAYYQRTDAALTLPAPPMWTDTSGDEYVFKGWYADASHTGSPITTIPAGSVGDKAFYAYWELVTITVSGKTLAVALQWIKDNAAPVWNYIIRLTENETTSAISEEFLIYTQNVEIKLVGDVAGRTVTLGGTGSLLTVGDGATLILGANISLTGISGNTAALVTVNSGGTLVMETGSKISGNSSGGSYSAGVAVNSSGVFKMNGGEISNNTGNNGGGGVYVKGTFTMSDGEISNNTSNNGGGVYVGNSSTFTMSGGKISSNTGTYGGGGVYVEEGRFEMSGGEISGNTTTTSTTDSYHGGGVMVMDGTFTKTSNGTIYGSNATDGLKNTADDGHAAYVSYGSTKRKRNDTAGEGVTLDSTKTGMAGGGWEDTLAQALSWVTANAVEGGNYTITVYADESMPGKTLNYSLKNVSITLSATTTRTISLSNTGSLLTVGENVTLTLGANISLVGMSGNTAALVTVNSRGTLVMETGSKISGNINNSSSGGGVAVNSEGLFEMHGGEISGNTASGGGVYVYSSTFEMSGGTISGNTANDSGGGVFMTGDGQFNMSGGGTISGNNASSNGGGVYLTGGTFEMSGGTISGNTANDSGGGVYVSNSSFVKTDGTIYGSNAAAGLKNTAGSGTGHAVYVYDGSKKRDSTAGTGVTLNNWIDGPQGGWEETLAEALDRVAANAVEGGNYTITVDADESMTGKELNYGLNNVSITLSATTTRTISLDSTGSLLTVGNGVTLTLGANISLVGMSSNTAALVTVNSGGTLVMQTGSKISGNTNTNNGGGVFVNGGTFEMNDGKISDNTGNGVCVSNGLFEMHGGEISGNTSGMGTGVYIKSGGTFTMSNGKISGNTSTSNGGGVVVSATGTFTMSNGEISGNTSTKEGGGVYVSGGTFEMSGGTISGNTSTNSTSTSNGGGVYVSGTFTKTLNGIIYGSNATDALKNTAGSGIGHAVYVNSGSKRRDTTAGESVTLNSATSGTAGGWE